MITNSIFDNDLYTFSVQNAILELYKDVNVEYRFFNRGNQRFSEHFKILLEEELENLEEIYAREDELKKFKEMCPYLKDWYFNYLKNFRFKKKYVKVHLTEDNNLDIRISGPWHQTIMYEVPILYIISELYFKTQDKNWNHDNQFENAKEKGRIMEEHGCFFAEFGTRRRRSLYTQETALKGLVRSNTLVGTSNVSLAMLYDIKSIGTMSHQFLMAQQALSGINYCNLHAMNAWEKVYNGNLGIILTDTVGLNAFLKDFGMKHAKLFDGTRQDSGNPFIYVDKMVSHYRKMNIDPLTKTIVFSDSLNVQKAVELNDYCKNKIKCSFGIGTNFTNDFVGSPALNMVIKLYSVNNFPVVKLGDSENCGKETGDKKAIEIIKWINQNKG